MNVDLSTQEKLGKDKTVLLTNVKERPKISRLSTGPWDTNFGKSKGHDGKMHEGLVPTSVSLLGGAPGAGKSTLCLQMAAALASFTNREVLLIAGEEGEDDIDERARRLHISDEIRAKIRVAPMGVDIDLGSVLEHYEPAGTFVDSLPTVMPDPADAVEFAMKLKMWSSAKRMVTVIVDHVTKEEEFAGQMALQHAVDGTFLFTVYDDGVRELKTVKNRNGPSGIVTLLNMTEHGLVYRSPDEDDDDDDDDD